MRVKRFCVRCGSEYWAITAKSKYCSDQCKSEARQEWMTNYRAEHKEYYAEKQKEWKELNLNRVIEYQKNRCASEKYKEKRRLAWRETHSVEERIVHCECCGKDFMTYNKSAKFCSEQCRQKAKYERHKIEYTCDICGEVFLSPTKNRVSQTCPSCQKRILETAKEAKEEENAKKQAERTQMQKARTAQKWVPATIECKECGKVFVQKSSTQKYCSRQCASKKFRTNKKFKTRFESEKYIDTDITVGKLFIRDNGVCYLCGEVCDLSDFTEADGVIICGDKYPSIDHIIPRAKGGEHSWDNVGLAHRKCNSIKRDKLII